MLNPAAKVRWHGWTRSERELMAKDLEWISPFVPDWVRDLHILRKPVDEERPITAAEVEHEYAYYKAVLTVYDRLILKKTWERRAYLIHEFMHVQLGPLSEYLETLEEEMDEKLLGMGQNAEERVVESITYAFLDFMRTRVPLDSRPPG